MRSEFKKRLQRLEAGEGFDTEELMRGKWCYFALKELDFDLDKWAKIVNAELENMGLLGSTQEERHAAWLETPEGREYHGRMRGQ